MQKAGSQIDRGQVRKEHDYPNICVNSTSIPETRKLLR